MSRSPEKREREKPHIGERGRDRRFQSSASSGRYPCSLCRSKLKSGRGCIVEYYRRKKDLCSEVLAVSLTCSVGHVSRAGIEGQHMQRKRFFPRILELSISLESVSVCYLDTRRDRTALQPHRSSRYGLPGPVQTVLRKRIDRTSSVLERWN